MNKSYLYNSKLTREQKYLFSEMNAIIERMIDSYIIEGCSEKDAKELTYSTFIKIVNREYNNK